MLHANRHHIVNNGPIAKRVLVSHFAHLVELEINIAVAVGSHPPLELPHGAGQRRVPIWIQPRLLAIYAEKIAACGLKFGQIEFASVLARRASTQFRK